MFKTRISFHLVNYSKIQELTKLLNNENFNKRFRRSEELIFLPIDKKSPYYPKGAEAGSETIPLFERQQWHCWMCITGTVRRSTDNYLIHCNIDTDLQIESTTPTSATKRNHQVVDYQLIMQYQKLFIELLRIFPTQIEDCI